MKVLTQLALSAITGIATAQTPPALNLESAIDEGLGNSPEIARAHSAKSESDWKKFEALGQGYLPKLSLNAHHYFDTRYTYTAINFGTSTLTMPGFYPNNEASLDVSVPIFDGLASTRNYQAASLNQQASSSEVSNSEFHLREEIRLAFYKALAAAELQSVAQQNVTTLEDHLKQIEMQKRGGIATNYDVLRVQVQLSEARADKIDAEDNVQTTRRKLTQLLGLEVDDRPLTGVLPVPEAKRIQDLKLNSALDERADLQALRYRAEAASKARAASGVWMVPSIYLSSQYSYYESQFMDNSMHDTGVYKNAYNVGVFLRWNLFDGGVAIAKARQAAEQQVQAEKSVQAAKVQVPYDFEYWKRRYLSNTDHYLSKKFDVTRSEESVRLAKEEQRAGTRTSTETLDAELDLFRAKAGVVNALVNAAEARIRLELTLGKEI